MGCIPSTADYLCLYDDVSDGKRDSGNATLATTVSSSGTESDTVGSNKQTLSREIEGMILKRSLIRDEILNTERKLVKHFELTEKVFVQPLAAAGIMDASTVKDQFNDYLIIKGIHTCLLSELERGTASIAAIFDEFVPALKIYKPYLQHFERRLRHRAQLIITNAAFNRFINSAQDNPLCRGQTVESLLVEPVQRVPRYKLLLMEASTSSVRDVPALMLCIAAVSVDIPNRLRRLLQAYQHSGCVEHCVVSEQRGHTRARSSSGDDAPHDAHREAD